MMVFKTIKDSLNSFLLRDFVIKQNYKLLFTRNYLSCERNVYIILFEKKLNIFFKKVKLKPISFSFFGVQFEVKYFIHSRDFKRESSV